MDYFISDIHFGHKNVIRFCDRPFKTVHEMNSKIVEKWNKKVTDADITAALNPKRLTTEEKIESLMTGTNKLSREEALEALKKPKQFTNKEKLQSVIDSDLYPNVKTEADAKILAATEKINARTK